MAQIHYQAWTGATITFRKNKLTLGWQLTRCCRRLNRQELFRNDFFAGDGENRQLWQIPIAAAQDIETNPTRHDAPDLEGLFVQKIDQSLNESIQWLINRLLQAAF